MREKIPAYTKNHCSYDLLYCYEPKVRELETKYEELLENTHGYIGLARDLQNKLDIAIDVLEEICEDGKSCEVCTGWETCKLPLACVMKVYSERLSKLKDYRKDGVNEGLEFELSEKDKQINKLIEDYGFSVKQNEENEDREEILEKLNLKGAVSPEFWEKEKEIDQKLKQKFDEERKSLVMSSEKFHKPFNI